MSALVHNIISIKCKIQDEVAAKWPWLKFGICLNSILTKEAENLPKFERYASILLGIFFKLVLKRSVEKSNTERIMQATIVAWIGFLFF